MDNCPYSGFPVICEDVVVETRLIKIVRCASSGLSDISSY